MAVITVPTIEDTSLSHIDTVKLVFSTIQITGDSWAAAKERLGDELYEEGQASVTMQLLRVNYETGMYALYAKESGNAIVEWHGKDEELKYRVIYNSQGEETWYDKNWNEIDPPKFNPGNITEKIFSYTADPAIASSKNHILFFSGTGEDLVLQAAHILGSEEIPLQNLNTLTLKVTMSDSGAVSGILRSNFLDGAELGEELLINFTEHVINAEIYGIGGHPSPGSEITVHPYIYKTGKDGEADAMLRSSVSYYFNAPEVKNIIKQSDGTADPRTLYVPGDTSDFCFSFGNSNRKYSFQMVFYLDKPAILQQVRAALAKVKIPSAGIYELPEETCIGFNSRSGAFLYYYDLDVLGSGYFLAVVIGCNGYARVNIYIAKMLLPPAIESAELLSSTDKDVPRYKLDLHGMRLKLNFWYNRLYFVLPYYMPDSIKGSREREHESKRLLYAIYPDAIDKTIQPRPVKAGVTGNIDGDGTCADICVYYPLNDADGNVITEAQENNHNMRMERLFDDNPDTGETGFDKVYMLEFSDLGDVLVNLDFDPKTKVFTQKFFNIFGTVSNVIKKHTDGEVTLSANDIFNHYDFEGRLLNSAGMTSPYDQNTLDSLGGLYTTSAQQIKYLIENNYLVIYAGSAFTIGYSQYNNNYLILFKCNVDKTSQMPIDRVRRAIAGELGRFRVCGDFLLRMNENGRFSRCEHADGSPVKSVKAKIKPDADGPDIEIYIPQDDSSMFCGADVADIVAADRNVIVLDKNAESRYAYRY